jgi:hypothetical protein
MRWDLTLLAVACAILILLLAGCEGELQRAQDTCTAALDGIPSWAAVDGKKTLFDLCVSDVYDAGIRGRNDAA